MSVYYVCNRCHETDLGPTGAGMSCWECATGGKDTSTNTDLDFGEMIGPGADAFWDIPQEEKKEEKKDDSNKENVKPAKH